METGTPVYCQNSRGENWQPVTVVEPADAADSYCIRFENGAVLGRTHRALKVRSSLTCDEENLLQRKWNGEQ